MGAVFNLIMKAELAGPIGRKKENKENKEYEESYV